MLWDNFLGKKFQADGRGPDVYDCYGLCIAVLAEQNIILPDYQVGDMLERQHHLFMFESETNFIKIPEPIPFCLVAFSVINPYVTHIGVVHPDLDKFIHLLNNRPSCIEPLNRPTWKNRKIGYYIHASISQNP